MDAPRQARLVTLSWCVLASTLCLAGGALAASSEAGGAPAAAATEEPAAPSEEPAPPKPAGDTGEPAQQPGSEQGSDEPASKGRGADEPAKAAVQTPKPVDPQTQYGVGVHLRGIFIPTWLLNLFLDASTPLNSVAFGAEFVRRKGSFDIVGSLDFGFYSPKDGNYLSKGGDPATDTDYVHFDGLNAISLAVHFIKHEQILSWMSFVWGGGVGLSIMLGDIFRASSSGCTEDNIDDIQQCRPEGMDPNDPMAWINDPANSGSKDEDNPDNPKLYREDGVPPVVPLVHLLVGMNFRIDDSFSVRVDGGFRNAFYVGATGHYFF